MLHLDTSRILRLVAFAISAAFLLPSLAAADGPLPDVPPKTIVADSFNTKSCSTSSTCSIPFTASSHAIYGIAPAFVGTVSLQLLFWNGGNYVPISSHSCSVPGFADCTGFDLVSPGNFKVSSTALPGTTGSWDLFVDYQ